MKTSYHEELHASHVLSFEGHQLSKIISRRELIGHYRICISQLWTCFRSRYYNSDVGLITFLSLTQFLLYINLVNGYTTTCVAYHLQTLGFDSIFCYSVFYSSAFGFFSVL